MGIEIVMPGHGYLAARRWARYKIDTPVSVTLQETEEAAVLEGCGSELNCGGMTLFLARNLHIGEQVTVEFTPPYASQPMTMNCVVRNRSGYRYGIEFVKEKGVA